MSKQKKDDRKIQYENFIKSKEWKLIRQRLFDERGKICEKCKLTEDIHVHHLNYKRLGGKERNSDLQVLCKKCHMELHGLKYDGKTKIKKKKHKGLPKYRKIAIERFGLRKSGNRGWKGLANTIHMINKGFERKFKSKKDAMDYVKYALTN